MIRIFPNLPPVKAERRLPESASMKLHPLPPTINLHNLTPCNFKCGFCYAGFASAGRTRIPQTELHEILRQIAEAPLSGGLLRRKVTFAGGEPLLSPTVVEDISHARSLS